MPTKFNFTLSEFTPGEAERITGLSTTMQRDWRRREFLSSTEGHARFDVFALAEMLFLKMMSDRGMGPQVAREIRDIVGTGIAFGALLDDAAFEGDAYPVANDFRAQSVVAKTTPHQKYRNMLPARYMVQWADGLQLWVPDVQAAIDALKPDDAAKLAGPIIVLDQWVIGASLLERAGRPLAHIEAVSN